MLNGPWEIQPDQRNQNTMIVPQRITFGSPPINAVILPIQHDVGISYVASPTSPFGPDFPSPNFGFESLSFSRFGSFCNPQGFGSFGHSFMHTSGNGFESFAYGSFGSFSRNSHGNFGNVPNGTMLNTPRLLNESSNQISIVD
jgi:hypothetical protein